MIAPGDHDTMPDDLEASDVDANECDDCGGPVGLALEEIETEHGDVERPVWLYALVFENGAMLCEDCADHWTYPITDRSSS